MTAAATDKNPIQGEGDAANTEIEALTREGIQALDRKQYAAAATLFKRALSRAPFRSDVRELLSLALDERSHSGEKGAGADSVQPIKSHVYAQTLDKARRRRHGRLEKLARPAILVALGIGAALGLFSVWRTHTGSEPPRKIVDQNFETFEKTARDIYSGGRFGDAVELIDNALRQNSADPESLKKLKAEFHYQEALAFSQKGDFDNTIKLLEVAVDLDPEKVNYHYELGWALHMKGRKLLLDNNRTEAAQYENAALNRLEKALELQPAHVDSLWMITRVLEAIGKKSEMKQYLETLVQAAPDSLEGKNARKELTALQKDEEG